LSFLFGAVFSGFSLDFLGSETTGLFLGSNLKSAHMAGFAACSLTTLVGFSTFFTSFYFSSFISFVTSCCFYAGRHPLGSSILCFKASHPLKVILSPLNSIISTFSILILIGLSVNILTHSSFPYTKC
jgi:hypothetical protein